MKYTKKLLIEIKWLPPCLRQQLCGMWTVVDVLSGHWKIKLVYGKCHSRGEIWSGVTCFCPHLVASKKTLVNTHMHASLPVAPRLYSFSLSYTHAHTITSVYDTENYNTTTTFSKLIYWNVDSVKDHKQRITNTTSFNYNRCYMCKMPSKYKFNKRI